MLTLALILTPVASSFAAPEEPSFEQFRDRLFSAALRGSDDDIRDLRDVSPTMWFVFAEKLGKEAAEARGERGYAMMFLLEAMVRNDPLVFLTWDALVATVGGDRVAWRAAFLKMLGKSSGEDSLVDAMAEILQSDLEGNGLLLALHKLGHDRSAEVVALLRSFKSVVDPATMERSSPMAHALLVLAFAASQGEPAAPVDTLYRSVRAAFRSAGKGDGAPRSYLSFLVMLDDHLHRPRAETHRMLASQRRHMNHLLASYLRQRQVKRAERNGPSWRLSPLTARRARVLIALARALAQAGGVEAVVEEVVDALETALIRHGAAQRLARHGGSGPVILRVLEGAQVAGRVQPGTAILRYSGKPTPDMDTLITLIKAGGDETAPRSMEVLTPAGRKKKLRVRPGRLGVALGSSTTDLVATEGTGPLVVLDVVDEAAEFLEIKRHQHRFGEAGPVDRLNALARELAKRTHEQRFARFPERLAATAMTLDAFGRRVGTLLSTRRLSDLRRLIASDPLRAAAHWEVLCIRLLAAGERPVEGEVFELFETYSAVLSGVTKDDRFAVWARTLGAPEAKTHLRETFELLQQAGDLTLSPSSAFPRIEKAEALAVAAGFHWLQHRCRIERLATRAANLQFEEAVAELKTLVEEAGLERLPLSRLDLLGAQARLHAGAGEASRATLLLRERLQLTESVLGNEGAALCRALIALARDALLRGEAQGALSLVRRPLHLADIFDHHLERAEAFILEAEALLELGRASAAVEPLDAALQLLRALMKHSVGSFIIAGEDHFERLGGTRAQGRRVQDVESARRSEALARAKVYEALGRVKDAREQYEKASFVWRLVEFELRQKRWSEAFSALVMAMDGQVARKDYDAIFEGLVLFARFFRDREEHRSALWFCLRAISLSENLRSQLAIDARDGPTRERFLQRTLEPYRWAIEALFELERAGQPFSEPRRAARPGFVEAGSWQMSLWKRSMDGLAELVPAFPLSKLGGSYAVATLALADAMRARTLTEQLVQPASDEPTTTIGWKGEDLRFLGKGQTLAVYSWLSEQVAMWRVRPGEPVRSWSIPLRSAPGDADLLTQLERFLAGLASESCGGEQEPRGLLPATADPCTSPEESGVDLFARLLSPVLEGVPAGEHLLISPDGPLLRSPFAAWPLPDGAGWVGDRYSVSYLYSLRLAREDATSARPSEAAKGGILVISDPIFEVSDPRLRGVDAAPSSWVIAAKGANAPSAAAAWRRLPGTTSEVENIRSAARDHGVGVVVLSGLCATEEAVASQRFSEHRRIHFATHGALPGAVSFLSQPALVLSQYGSSQAGHDGLLTTREVARLDLRDVELVVLSACETGLGESLGGEGLQSLGRAFRLAGARGLVTSLWRVDDKATASLMGAFYRHLLSGAPASSALQRAQTEMRKNNPKYAAPYYWAAFRYLGM